MTRRRLLDFRRRPPTLADLVLVAVLAVLALAVLHGVLDVVLR